MLSNEQIAALIERLRKQDRDETEEIEPQRSYDEDQSIMRHHYFEQGWKIAQDKFSRDQLDILAKKFDIDPEIMAQIDISDAFLLFNDWFLGVSLKEFEEFKALGNRTFEDIVLEEDRDLIHERRQKRLLELREKYGWDEAFCISRAEIIESKKNIGSSADAPLGFSGIIKKR